MNKAGMKAGRPGGWGTEEAGGPIMGKVGKWAVRTLSPLPPPPSLDAVARPLGVGGPECEVVQHDGRRHRDIKRGRPLKGEGGGRGGSK